MTLTPHQITNRPLVSLMGPWLHNKGDVLMLRSVVQHYPRANIGAPVEFWLAGIPTESVVRVGRRPSLGSLAKSARALDPGGFARLAVKRALLSFPPRMAYRLSGHVPADRASALLDCSGFAYGDVWPTQRVEARRAYYAALRRRSVPIALLPQAFGPFERPEMREATRRLLDLCDIVVARDVDSLQHVKSLALEGRTRLLLAPDITHLLEGVPPEDVAAWQGRVCIVPNARMLDRTQPGEAAAYTDFLVETVALIREARFEPWFVVHEANDASLVNELNDRFSQELPVLDEDASRTKGIFACCRAVVGSRYHALVSALSSGTPAMGMSWSHKYERLFEDYGIGHLMRRPGSGSEGFGDALEQILSDPERGRIADLVSRKAAEKKSETAAMWAEVDRVLKLTHAT